MQRAPTPSVRAAGPASEVLIVFEWGAIPRSRSNASSTPNPRPRRLGMTDAVSSPFRARFHANVPWTSCRVSFTGSGEINRRRAAWQHDLRQECESAPAGRHPGDNKLGQLVEFALLPCRTASSPSPSLVARPLSPEQVVQLQVLFLSVLRSRRRGTDRRLRQSAVMGLPSRRALGRMPMHCSHTIVLSRAPSPPGVTEYGAPTPNALGPDVKAERRGAGRRAAWRFRRSMTCTHVPPPPSSTLGRRSPTKVTQSSHGDETLAGGGGGGDL